MLTCKQVSKALAENRFYELPLRRKIGLFMHAFICPFCGKANRQIITFTEGYSQIFTVRRERTFYRSTLKLG